MKSSGYARGDARVILRCEVERAPQRVDHELLGGVDELRRAGELGDREARADELELERPDLTTTRR